MSLTDTISYVALRCKCERQKSSKVVHAALGEGTLRAVANRLIPDPIDPYQLKRVSQIVALLDEDARRRLEYRLISDPDMPTHLSEYVDTGLFPVPSNLWAGYTWTAFDKRSRPRSDAKFREQTADGRGEVGPVWSKPTIATADIDAWLDRSGGSQKVAAGTAGGEKGLSGTIYEAIQLKPGVYGFGFDLKPILERVWRYLRSR